MQGLLPSRRGAVSQNKMCMDFWKRQPFDLAIPGEWSNCDLCFMKGRGQLLRLIQEQPDGQVVGGEKSIGASVTPIYKAGR